MKLKLNRTNARMELIKDAPTDSGPREWKIILSRHFVKTMVYLLVLKTEEELEFEYLSEDGVTYTGKGYLKHNEIIGSGAIIDPREPVYDIYGRLKGHM